MTFDRDAFVEQFRQEAREHLAQLSAGILALERRPGDRAIVDGLFRAAHSLKGGARMMGFDDVGTAAHRLEDSLESLRCQETQLDPDLGDRLLRQVDDLAHLLASPLPATPDAGTQGHGDAASPPGHDLPDLATPTPTDTDYGLSASLRPSFAASGGRVGRGGVRIDVARLDSLLNLAGEMLPVRERARSHLRELRALARRAEELRRALTGAAADLPDEHRATLGPAVEDLATFAGDLGALAKGYAHAASATSDALAGLQNEVLRVRLTPLAMAFAPLPRAARDLARARGKQVRLDLEGGEVEVDRLIVDALADPLLHLVRNAIDHGIESPDERVAGGKEPEGRIRVAARYRGDRVVVTVADDGRGLDPSHLRATATTQGLLPDGHAAALSDDAALRLIFRPGFSTAPEVSETSGRGVGMDVVRASVERLSGRVAILNEPSRGVAFEIELPLSLAIVRVLLVEASGHELAIPMAALEEVTELAPTAIVDDNGRPTARLGGRLRQIVPLATLWGQESLTFPNGGDGAAHLASVPPRADGSPATERSAPWRVIALATGGRRQAIVVDRIVGESDVVLKPLGALLRPLALVQGGAILPDGRVALVLDPAHLGQLGRLPATAPPRRPEATARRRVLVVEDTATTRELERRVLEQAGFAVETARDGVEALEILGATAFDAVVTDLELPRLGGIDLIRQMHAAAGHATRPIVVVSTRSAEAERLAAREAGAAAYVAKVSFDQAEFVATLRRLIEQ